MTQTRDADRTVLRLLVDVALTLLALYLASWTRYVLPWGVALDYRFVALPLGVYLMTAVTWPVGFVLASVYRLGNHATLRFSTVVNGLLRGIALSLLLLSGTLYFTYRLVPRRLFFYFAVLDIIVLVAVRVVDRMAHGRSRRQDLPRLLVVGVGRLAMEFALQARNSGLWDVVGFLVQEDEGTGRSLEGLPVLGTVDSLQQVVVEQRISEVVLAVPLSSYDGLFGWVKSLDRLAVEVSVIPDYFELAFFRMQVTEYLGFPIVRLRASAIEGWNRVVKRAFDLLLSVPLLFVSLPFLGGVALLIRAGSPGPAIFKQQRIGENGKIFTVLKFRTMVQNAEALFGEVAIQTSDGQVLHKRPGDPRVTGVGRFLRRYSIDELPQLWNVIRGEMSLVGPRPELPCLVDRYEDWQRLRFAVPPGITGWWQVSGRSDRPMHLNVEDDLYYIQNYSVWLDLRILWRTLGAVLSGRGAY